jgi:hypothetical protein
MRIVLQFVLYIKLTIEYLKEEPNIIINYILTPAATIRNYKFTIYH